MTCTGGYVLDRLFKGLLSCIKLSLKSEPLRYRPDMESARDIDGDARRLVEGAWRIRKLTIWLEALIGIPAMIVGLLLWGNHFRT
jgi:hypothetical protein